MIELLSNNEEWSKYVEKKKEATIFHTLEWKNVIEKTFGYKTYYFVSKDGSVKGIMPMFQVNSFLFGKRFISLPFAFSAGPIYEEEENLDEIFEKVSSETAGSKYIEIRMNRKLPADVVDKMKLNEYFDTYLSTMKLRDTETIWKEMDKAHRNAIRKAERDGVTVRELTDENELKKYYRLKLILSAKKYGIPCEPLKFYKNLWNEFSKKNMIKIFLAEYNGRVIGGIIMILYKDEMLYYSGAADDNFLHLKPYNILIWEAMKFGFANKYKIFNFGTSSHQGLLDFKEKWGATSSVIPVYTTEKRNESEAYSLFTKIWKIIPVSISSLFGPFLVKQKGG